MKQLNNHKRLFLLVGLINTCMLFVQCLKTCNRTNPYPIPSQQSTKQKRPKKALLRVRQVPSPKAHYMQITIQPSNIRTEISQYTLMATTLAGRGTLLAPRGKDQGKLQYNICLTEETKLDKIYLSRGNVALFKQGKPIEIRCAYQPDVGTQQGETHQVQIRVCVYDRNHQLLEQQLEEVNFHISHLPQPKKPKTTKPAKKRSSHVTKKQSG